VSPGPVATDLWLGAGGVAATIGQATGARPEDVASGAASAMLTGRFTRPEEVADLVLLLASELCANAIVHSRSGEAGGQFSVDIDWAPDLARVVVGDQGSAKLPQIPARTSTMGESGRGLHVVSSLCDEWGCTPPGPRGKVVWAMFTTQQAR